MGAKRPYDTGIWLKLVIGDFLKETAPLSTEAIGAYILLATRYWTHGPLKDDDSMLARLTRLSIEQFAEICDDLAQLFEIRDGYWRHEGWDSLRAEAAEHKRKKTDAARKAANQRWERERQKNTEPAPPGLPDDAYN